ncbi:tyrosine-type recombinase/integrase [Dactylosporangium sp. CS-047395]|uniref:tyrosine-type recombinase/integrase n=1 Tax=Dactylosporangium sp. CS-047395 TaxID=3239936 RepID=UPI003D8FD6D7
MDRATPAQPLPITVAGWIPLTLNTCTPSTATLYRHYLELFAQRHGDDDLASIRATHISDFATWTQTIAQRRRSSIDGRSAKEHAIAAVRKLFTVAMQNDIIIGNPAAVITKPRRHPTRRVPLTSEQLNDVFDAAADHETVLLRFLLETACRREGLLNLTPKSVHPTRQTVILDEKHTQHREQPVSAAIIDALADSSCPLYTWTRRRLDALWVRLGRELDWFATLGVTTHWFRHTTITRVEHRTGSYTLAAAFAGHHLPGSTGTYINITVADVCWAFEQAGYGDHPLARQSRRQR